MEHLLTLEVLPQTVARTPREVFAHEQAKARRGRAASIRGETTALSPMITFKNENSRAIQTQNSHVWKGVTWTAIF